MFEGCGVWLRTFSNFSTISVRALESLVDLCSDLMMEVFCVGAIAGEGDVAEKHALEVVYLFRDSMSCALVFEDGVVLGGNDGVLGGSTLYGWFRKDRFVDA